MIYYMSEKLKKIAVFFNNGGVGRTTTTENIGACLADEMKEIVYEVDLDNVALLTEFQNLKGGRYVADIIRELHLDDATYLKKVLQEKEQLIDESDLKLAGSAFLNKMIEIKGVEFVSDIIKQKGKVRREDFATTPSPNLFVLKNRRNEINDKLFQIKDENGVLVDRTDILIHMFSDFKEGTIIFDCPQYFELPTLNALRCADYLLCPLEISPKGLGTLESLLDAYKQTLLVNPNLKLLGFFANKVKMNYRRFKQTFPILKKELGESFFNAYISENEHIVNSQAVKKTIFEYGDLKATQEYINLTNEIKIKMQ
jgi:chromosome partitioning protein